MEYWLGCLLVSVLGTGIAKLIWKHELDGAEVAITIGIATGVAAIMIGCSTYRDYADTQVLNGYVVSKQMDTVHCRHSYQCNCYTTCSGSGKHRHCSRHCSTCYEHNKDYDWVVKTTLNTIDIDTIDRQGKQEPPRWTIVKIGEPVSTTVGYTNYIKGSPDSLFNHVLENSGRYNIPAYKTGIFDYYRINRVVQIGTNIPFVKDINDGLNDSLKTLGHTKHANIIPVFTTYDQNFARALESKWLGGKRNDIVVVTGLDGTKIKWVKVFSWSSKSLINYDLESKIKALGVLETQSYVKEITESITKYYIQRSPEEFKYLDDAIKPSDWVIYTSLFLSFFGSLGLGCIFSRN